MSISATTFTYVAELVHRHAGIRLEPGKEYLVESRLAQAAREAGARDVDAFVTRLRADPTPASLDDVVEALTTNETSWFRDVTPFRALCDHVVPQVRAARPTGPLRIWSAACSSGQEPYSIAMSLADLPDGDVDILATDLSARALERAREGAYSSLEMNRGLPASALVRHFERSGAGWRVVDAVRSRVRFARHNLLGAPPAWGVFDVVFLRNVLIYFDLSTRADVLDQVLRSLRPGGGLVLGSTESTAGVHDGCARVRAGGTTLFRARTTPSTSTAALRTASSGRGAALPSRLAVTASSGPAAAPGPAVPVAAATAPSTPRGAGPL